MSDQTTAPLAYMGEDGAFPLEIRRCDRFALVATLEAGEEAYGPIFAAAPETAEKLRALSAVTEELLAVVMIQNGNLHADINEMTARARAALARARGA